jgi:hypothetical protein
MDEFNPTKIIDEFKKIQTIPREGIEELSKLQDNIGYVAPELVGTYFFDGWKSMPGLVAILKKYASSNEEAFNLYEKTKIVYEQSLYEETL